MGFFCEDFVTTELLSAVRKYVSFFAIGCHGYTEGDTMSLEIDV